MRLIVLMGIATAAAAATCESVATLKLPATTIAIAQLVPGPSFSPPTGAPINDLPPFCRVAGSIAPSPDSDIKFEVWMPASGWNGKFHGIGNGGFAGSLSLGQMAGPLKHGYAAATTDTGHSGGNAAWALGHPEKVIDYGHRAIHEMTVKAKAIIAAFYGSAPKKSYFASCSNGGRQALMEAQRYPGDYDGIIAGAPANDFTGIAAGFLYNQQALLKDPAAYIPAAKLKAIEAAALAACDAADGLADGLIDQPDRCRFDPAVLTCKDADADHCLTAPQLAALKKIYDGPTDSKGRRLFPGFVPGAETGNGGWAPWITGLAPEKSLQFFFGTEMFRNMVAGDPAWDYKTFDVDRDAKLLHDKLAPVLNATDSNLEPFRARGGKLILFHGWCDAALTPTNTITYYQNVVAKSGVKKAGEFVRLYMLPGVQHCAGGPGPNRFIGTWTGADTDMMLALERWVETGTAPAALIAAGANRTRPICPYPQVAKYKGAGSVDDAANFTCAAGR
jgi:feruloyl esterase